MSVWVLLVAACAAVALFLQFRWNWYPLQYLYFLRFPLLLGAVLVLAPLSGCELTLDANRVALETRPFRNLFVLEWDGLLLVAFLAVLAAWTVAHAARWVYAHSQVRLSLPLRGYRKDGTPRNNVVLTDPAGARARHTIYALLALPLVATTVALSPGDPVTRLVMAAAGVGLAFLVREGSLRADRRGSVGPDRLLAAIGWMLERVGRMLSWLVHPAFLLAGLVRSGLAWVGRQPAYAALERWLVGRPWLGPRSRDTDGGYASDEESVASTERNLRRYLSMTFVVYLLFLGLLWPGFRAEPLVSLQDRVPALAYALLLLMLLAWVLSWFSLRLDKYRLPAELVLVLVASLVYGFADTDHTYAMEGERCASGVSDAQRLRPDAYLEAWSRGREGVPLVLVAASGGGIAASYWTATVLAGLDRAVPGFARSLSLVSATSGGALGALYYLAAYREPASGSGPLAPPGDAALDRAVCHAGRSSLGAMAWGIVYPDLVRLVFPPLAFGADRGRALERRWSQVLPEDARWLSDWRRAAREGWRPAVVLNATFTEAGSRFLLSPLDLSRPFDLDPDPKRERGGAGGEGPDDAGQGNGPAAPPDPPRWAARSLSELYPGADVPVVTAARLSATFPFVTPVARPETGSCEDRAFHVADGGYVDNLGVLTLVDFVERLLPALREQGRKVVVVEIRASNSNERAEPATGAGFRMETLGPAETLLAVRSSSQLERNELALRLLRANAPDVVHKESIVFENREDTPTSWHLSSDERRSIRRYWAAQRTHNREALEELAAALGAPLPPAAGAPDPTIEPCDTAQRAGPRGEPGAGNPTEAEGPLHSIRAAAAGR